MFHKDRHMHDGYYSLCKSCKLLYAKQRLLENGDDINARRRENRHKYAEHEREYRKLNRERLDAKNAEWEKDGKFRVYRIDLDDGLFYIGATSTNLKRRLSKHKYYAKSPKSNFHKALQVSKKVEIYELCCLDNRSDMLELENLVILESNKSNCLNMQGREVAPSL